MKNIQLEKLLNEMASEAILLRLLDDPQRIGRENLSRLLPEHAAIFQKKYPELWDAFSGEKEDSSSPSASAHDI